MSLRIPKLIVSVVFGILVPSFALSQISGPTLGFVFEPETGLRSILGIPGSSTMGELLELGNDLLRVELSPRHDYGLAVTRGNGVVVFLDLRNAPVSMSPIEGVTKEIDRIVMSPTGSSAALLDSASQRVWVLTGLPDSPRVQDELDVSPLAESLTAMAISDDAEALLLGFWDGDVGSLYLLGKENARFVSRLGYVSTISFSHNSHDAFVADQSNNEALLMRDVWGERSILAGERDGLSRPTALGVSDDGRRVFIANSETGTIVVLDSTGGVPNLISCGCKFSGLHRMKENSVFRLTEPRDGPVLILDGANKEPQIYFVPAAR